MNAAECTECGLCFLSGPGIVAAGVWGLTVSSNYYEANNGAPPTYSVHGQHHQVTQTAKLSSRLLKTQTVWNIVH